MENGKCFFHNLLSSSFIVIAVDVGSVKMKAVRFCILAILILCAPGLAEAQTEQSVDNLVKEFETTKEFWRQFEVARKLVSRSDKSVLPMLESWLSNNDKSDRPEGQGISAGKWSLQAQIRSDRYFAVHVLGDLEEKRVVPILLSLLRDEEINYSVAWALGEIGDERAIGPLIEALRDKSSDMRFGAISALEKLGAVAALPHLHALLNDQEKTHFGAQISVAGAAKAAIAALEIKR